MTLDGVIPSGEFAADDLRVVGLEDVVFLLTRVDDNNAPANLKTKSWCFTPPGFIHLRKTENGRMSGVFASFKVTTA